MNAQDIFNNYSHYVLMAILIVDYILGTTNTLKGNSIIEAVLRSIGAIVVMLSGGKLKMQKRKGKVN